MAVQHWQASAMPPACPTYAQLIRHGFLDPGVSPSSASEFQIECAPSEVTVVWTGPDRQLGTLDDDRAPERSGGVRPMTLSSLGVALPVALLASLTSSVLGIIATLFRTSSAHAFRRVAAIAGWLVIGVSAVSGLIDMTISRIAATRPGLSPADAERSRALGNRVFLAQAVVGAAAGLPGAILMPVRRRRRESVRTAHG